MIIAIIIFIFTLFIRQNTYEHAYWNIPTRYCKPSKYTSSYDIRGLMPVPYIETQIPFGMSELIGPSHKSCYDTW